MWGSVCCPGGREATPTVGLSGDTSQSAIQGSHGFERDRLRAGLRRDGFGPGGGELGCGVAGVAEVVGEGLAFLGEAGAEEAVEAVEVGGGDAEFGEARGEF